MKSFIKKILNIFLYVRVVILTYIIRLLTSVKSNRIFIFSMGSQYSCNPKYITEYILKNCVGQYEIVWAFDKRRKKTLSHLPNGIKVVFTSVINSLSFIYNVNTAKFIIHNTRFKHHEIISKRKGQKYIMTWHASYGLKPIETDAYRANIVTYTKWLQKQNQLTDLMLSSCAMRTAEIRRAQLYSGEILEAGTPRNDIFFSSDVFNEKRKCIYKQYNIPESSHILLYAPTFRNGFNFNNYIMDWSDVLKVLYNKLGKDYYVLIRLHPIMKHSNIFQVDNPKTINVSDYDDMQELLLVSDVLITDYSSSPFDFCYTRRPIFMYMPDFEEYTGQERGALSFDVSSLPFPVAYTENELIQNLSSFNNQMYQDNLKFFVDNVLKTYENGHACAALVNWMQENN